MKTISPLRTLLAALCLSLVHIAAYAQLLSPKLEVNSINGDRVVAVVRFPSPVVGDLYLATEIAGNLWFISPGPTGINLSLTPTAYQKNSAFNADMTVLDISTVGIAPGFYPLYQVVTLPDANPLEVSNWIGGVGGLGKVEFKINTNNVPTPTPLPPTVVPTPTATAMPTPTATVAPTATPKPTFVVPSGLITLIPSPIPSLFVTPTPTVKPTFVVPSGLITFNPTLIVTATPKPTVLPTFVVPTFVLPTFKF